MLTEPMFEFSRSVRRQVEFDGRKLVSVEGGGCSKRSNLQIKEFCILALSINDSLYSCLFFLLISYIYFIYLVYWSLLLILFLEL